MLERTVVMIVTRDCRKKKAKGLVWTKGEH
jgi:hypothetical protein